MSIFIALWDFVKFLGFIILILILIAIIFAILDVIISNIYNSIMQKKIQKQANVELNGVILEESKKIIQKKIKEEFKNIEKQLKDGK